MKRHVPKTIHIQYYALLREERKKSSENFTTDAQTARELYAQLKTKYRFRLNTDMLRIAINDKFSSWSARIKHNDRIIFIPPVAGG